MFTGTANGLAGILAGTGATGAAVEDIMAI